MDLGGSLHIKPISIMDIGYCVQMNPKNTFLWPLEASKRPKTGLKIANFHGFEPHKPSGRLFLGGPWWILASKAYIHYGHWLLCPDEHLKRLFMASGSLQKAQNRPQNGKFSWF